MDLRARLSAGLTGRYEILREIGRGGMSVVFLARDLRLDREVVLKALRPELTQSVGAERFQREIQLVAHFEHLHLLHLYESDTADGVLYYAMPYARGGSLRDLLRKERQLGLADAVRITREVAEGIAHAHERGVVHRDLKPENILFLNGHAVVADFGIAHAYTEAGGETFTEYGLAIGTPPYMSPEQAAGERRIDRRSDVYALACVVYEMLTGGPPFEGPTTQAVLAKHMHERVPSLLIVRPNVPRGMAAAVEKALEKVPGDRYQSAPDFARDLERGWTHAPRGRPVRAILRQLVSTPWVVGLAALVAAAAAGLPIARAVLAGNGRPSFEGRPQSLLVLPYHTNSSSDVERAFAAEITKRVTHGLNTWRSTRAVTDLEVSGALADRGLAGPTLGRVRDGIDLARGQRVQALVTLTATIRGDSARAEAMLYDAVTGRPVGESVLASGLAAAPEAVVSSVVARLLGLGDAGAELEVMHRRSAHPDALAADSHGRNCLERWRLGDAERAFRQAIALDTTFAMAQYHLALALYWQVADGSRRFNEAQAEIAQWSLAAVNHVPSGLVADSLLIHAFRQMQQGDYAGYAGARDLLRALLEADPADRYARLTLAAVEVDDTWLELRADGTLAPRSDLEFARRTFADLLRNERGFELGYGHLGRLYRQIATVAHRGGCSGYERPRSDALLAWDEPTPMQVQPFCPVALDSVVLMPYASFQALPRPAVLEAAQRAVREWSRLLNWWAGAFPRSPKPRMELAALALDERRRLDRAPPEVLDSLARVAARHTAEALGLQEDTLPVDLVRLGARYLGGGNLDAALRLTESGLAGYGQDAPPDLAANPFLASGHTARALDLVAGRTTMSFISDPETGARIGYGGAERAIDRIRVLAATGVVGPPLHAELESVTRTWLAAGYGPREVNLLRAHALLNSLTVATALDPATLGSWGAGVEIGEPLWMALTERDADPALVRRRILEAGDREVPRYRPADRDFALGVVASHIGDHRLALAFFSRLDSVPLTLEQLDTGWGLRTLSYLKRAEACEALGELDEARTYGERFRHAWTGGDALSAALGRDADRLLRRLGRGP